MALALMLFNLALYFLGYHSDADKYTSAETITRISFWVIAFACIIPGTMARRSEIPATEDFGYGGALLTGFMISVFAGLFGIVTGYLYFHLINPNFIEVLIQAVTAKAEAKGAGSAQIAQMEKGIRFMMGPIMSPIVGFLVTVVCGTLVSLITSIFIRRTAVEDLSAPPAV